MLRLVTIVVKLIKLYYKINDIPEELIDSTFKYTILKSTDGVTFTEYDDGNFSTAASGSEYIILDEEKIKSGMVYYYRVYLWIEGSVTDNTEMQGKIFNAELRADYEITETISDFTYEEISNNYSCLVDGETVTVGEPIFTYTGECKIVNDNDGNWKVRFLSDGTFTSSKDVIIDVFLVGGGGGGANSNPGGSGGGGGYTRTERNVVIESDKPYPITIGLGGNASVDGGNTFAFDIIAGGGFAATSSSGGNGGSGGGSKNCNGGSNGSDGTGKDSTHIGGKGQISTPGINGETGNTREFGEESGKLYSGGGGGGYGLGGEGGGAAEKLTAENNTGGGGGGGLIDGTPGGGSGSGIVVIRNAR